MLAGRPDRHAGAIMPEAKSVLVVDDEAAIRGLIADALDFDGYTVRTARDGADALEKVARDRPDAIILDLMMPVMDGRSFLSACRRDPRCADIPILVVSAAHDLGAIAPELGARACLAKPFDIDVLLAVVDRLVHAEAASPRVGLVNR
jgi:two-component system, OmpR family, response regulator MprA